MENQVMVLVPSQEKRWLLISPEGKREFRQQTAVVDFFQTLEKPIVLLGIMGGPGQNLFLRAYQMGFPVFRIPWYRLAEVTDLATGASPEERASAIRQAWEKAPEEFYQFEALDPQIMVLRELTRVRLSIQETFRKPANLQYQAAWRELEVLLPEGEQLIQLRTFFSNPRFIEGAKEDEKELENRIRELVKLHPLWPLLHPDKDSVLPPVKGLGPSLAGSILAEIGDIRRFPTRESLRAYARFHLSNGEFPKRARGEVSAWNRYLNRAIHWWTADPRLMSFQDHPWKNLYLWKKAKEMQAHPEVVPKEFVNKRGQKKLRYDYTLQHLDLRAKRWVGSQFLNYLWDLWQVVDQGEDPELWYPGSNWPHYFARVKRELEDGLLAYLDSEIPKRRRRGPREEPRKKRLASFSK